MAIIETKDLAYRYSPGTPFEKTAVDGVNIQVEKGEFLGVIGHTGSGKSTLIQMLNGLLRPTSGQVLLNGKDIWAEPKKIRAVRFQVGMVFQYPEYQLFEETVLKDIMFGPKNMGLTDQEAETRAREAAHFTGLKEERAALPERRSLPLPLRPEGKRYFADPALIVQVHQAEQLTQELAALHPAYVYVPVEILDSDFPRLAPFLEQGAQVVAVLPRVITDDQAEDMHAMLSRAAENGVQEALVGNMGHIFFARRAGMRVRGDFGLNVFNSFTEEVLQQAGLVSATASFELRVAQIRDLAKSIDTEMIVYGRLPCMITEQCIIRNSAGRCNCSVPNNLADRRGALFPVLPAFGHRNQIFNAHKLYLADKHEDYETAGLWGVRLMFTTETPRECVAVTQSYLGLTDYRPNGLTRGLYYRGVE